MPSKPHLTTRRSFIAATGFGGVSLYALWVAYGAAPGPRALLGLTGDHHPDASSGHGGHGAAQSDARIDEFRRLTAEFVARYRMPDGSVYPRRSSDPTFLPVSASPVSGAHAHGHSAPAVGGHASSHDAGHGVGHGAEHNEPSHGGGHEPASGGDILDVYLLAEKWSYEPAHLRLDAGVPYRLRMMAADIAHGASIQFGGGSRMIRLRPNTVTELRATFAKPGTYLVYCTVYCGQGHDLMQARIEVV